MSDAIRQSVVRKLSTPSRWDNEFIQAFDTHPMNGIHVPRLLSVVNSSQRTVAHHFLNMHPDVLHGEQMIRQ